MNNCEKRLQVLNIIVIIIIALVSFKINFFKDEKASIKIDRVIKASGKCYIPNCREYMCQSDTCCQCQYCYMGTTCYGCAEGWVFGRNGCELKKCYVKRGNGTENEYYFGVSSDVFPEEVPVDSEDKCDEQSLCYKVLKDNRYVFGKYAGQQGYEYVGTECPSPACYKDVNGNYRWTDTPNQGETKVFEIMNQNDCVTLQKSTAESDENNKGNNMLLFVIGAIVIAIGAILIIFKSKDSNNNNYNNMRNNFN